MDLQYIKNKFSIVGNSELLNRAINKAIIVSPTDISVLVTGESGVGKESIPKIIHSLSKRKHNSFISVNCGAIPEGTIDSELFGHEKGAFTGALGSRKGYFEAADGGTIFLDEVGELPITTQVRLLRVLETGEFIKVGSSEVKKTNVRIIAATNSDLIKDIKNKKFREDLYYRLNTVEINLPSLRERPDDIHLIFRKFALDFSEKYKISPIRLNQDAIHLLKNYRWYGNIRQLRNITEQISIFEKDRLITREVLSSYLPDNSSYLPSVIKNESSDSFNNSIVLELKKEVDSLKKILWDLVSSNNKMTEEPHVIIEKNDKNIAFVEEDKNRFIDINKDQFEDEKHENLSIELKEIDLIKKALKITEGRRKEASEKLGISERTLYRKIKDYNL